MAPIADAVAQGAKVIAVDTTLDDTSMLTARTGTDGVEVGRDHPGAGASGRKGALSRPR